MSQEWIQQSERSNPFTLKLIRWIALHIGRRFSRILLYPIVAYFLLTSNKVVRSSRSYLKRILGRPAKISEVARHIYTFASTVLDRVYFLTDQYERFDVRVHNAEIFDSFLKDKRGAILLGSHLGSFEVLRALAISRYHLPVKILMYRDHNQMITTVLNALNPAVAASVINLSDADAMLQMQEAIESGYLVGMLGDRVSGNEKKTSCKLLGEATDFPSGPALLASLLKTPIIVFFGLYRGGNRYDIHFELLGEEVSLNRKTRNEEIQTWMQKYADHIEKHMRQAPYNWFNFYDYWKDYNKD